MAASVNNDTEKWIHMCILGSGAFGIVELWKNMTTMEQIAVKKCQINIMNLTPRQRERWNHEVHIMNQLKHPNIVSTRDIPNQISQDVNGLPILCMEYCSKGDLRSVLNKCANLCGVREQDALRIMYDVSSAVEYIHNHNITHRDLKPGNIVMQQIKDRKVVYKLIDLGYAKELGDASTSASIVGTLNYLAPELLWKKTYSCSVDYWSLGILFYEIITGTRPFLPNMQLSKIWMNHIQGKAYEHISAREINGQVYFSKDIEDPTHVSDYIKSDLVQWFRVVLHWDPKKRGKSKNEFGSEETVVFTMLKSIFDKKIIHTFIVSHYKFESYCVNSYITTGELKRIIYEKVNINENHQILTDSTGRILSDPKVLSREILQDNIIIVFHSERLCVEQFPKPKLSESIQEMIKRPRTEYDYYTLKRYYGATSFFMKNELELYRSYILALSIIIDLSDIRLKSVSAYIKKLITDKECLATELESTSELVENVTVEKHTQDFSRLKQKISKFFDGIKQMMEKYNTLIQNNEELKSFGDVNWMSEISAPYDNALNLVNKWYTENRNGRENPCAMVKLVFEFLATRDKQLSSVQLAETSRNIMQFRRKLIQLEKALTSFTELLKFYRQDIKTFHQGFIEEYGSINRIAQLNDESGIAVGTGAARIAPNSNNSTNIAVEDDSVIYESIVICNMLGGLLTEMDVWRRKLSALSNFEN